MGGPAPGGPAAGAGNQDRARRLAGRGRRHAPAAQRAAGGQGGGRRGSTGQGDREMMKYGLAAICAGLALASLAAPAMAEDASGKWKVAGSVSGVSFTLDCKFQQTNQALSGVCVDTGISDKSIKIGRVRTLTKGGVS